ncbi:unnamed protein product [Cuscuta campestris]|uniref:Uncharacterized protein n=1 Tax=Cuscuta campestris TaxID=132261 RepID=A0A484M2S7_9ASTE|nr:unnamed protein product [Cuscuta campestris]
MVRAYVVLKEDTPPLPSLLYLINYALTDQEFKQYLGDRTDTNLPTLEDIFEDIDEAEMDVEPTPHSNNPTDADEEAGKPETSQGPGKAIPGNLTLPLSPVTGSAIVSVSRRLSLSKSPAKQIRPSNCSPVPFLVAYGEDFSESPGEVAAQIHCSAISVRQSLFPVVCEEGLSDSPVEVAAQIHQFRSDSHILVRLFTQIRHAVYPSLFPIVCEEV